MRQSYRYLDVITAAFVTTLLCANLIGASKVVRLGGFTFSAAVIFFPVSYIFGDVLTEVYGYAKSRRVVWLGFGAMLFTSFVSLVIVALPALDLEQQEMVRRIFGQTPRIFLASLVAYFVGEFLNSFVLAKMKVLTAGKWLWARTIGSTVIGEAIDSVLFYPLAFAGVWSWDIVLAVSATNYGIKVLIEVLMTPVTYWIVARLKSAEHEDYFDRDTRFSPFAFDPSGR